MKIVRPKTVFPLIFTLVLSGCFTGGGGTATEMVAATTAIRGVTQAVEPPSETDYKLSCNELNMRTGNLYARYAELEKEQKARQRKKNITNGLINTGITVAGIAGMGNAGTLNGVRNVGIATGVARTGLSGVASAETNTQQLKDVTNATLIAQRVNQLERVKMEKGC